MLPIWKNVWSVFITWYFNWYYFISVILTIQGTTWVSEIVWQLYNNGEISAVELSERVVFLELEYSTKPNDSQPCLPILPSPRIIKTHLTYDVIPKGDSEETRSRYIYVARNPKDVAVSKFHFSNATAPRSGYNGPWEFFVKLFIDGKGMINVFVNLRPHKFYW